MRHLIFLAFLLTLSGCRGKLLNEAQLGVSANKNAGKKDVSNKSKRSLVLNLNTSSLNLNPGKSYTLSFYASSPTVICEGKGPFTYENQPSIAVKMTFASDLSACDALGYFKIADNGVVGTTAQSYNLKNESPTEITILPVSTFALSFPDLKYDLKSELNFYIACEGDECPFIYNMAVLDFSSSKYNTTKHEFYHTLDNFLSPNNTYIAKSVVMTSEGLVFLQGVTNPTSDGYTFLLTAENQLQVTAALPKEKDIKGMISLAIFEGKNQIALQKIPATKFPLTLHFPNRSFCFNAHATTSIGAFVMNPKSAGTNQPVSATFDSSVTCP